MEEIIISNSELERIRTYAIMSGYNDHSYHLQGKRTFLTKYWKNEDGTILHIHINIFFGERFRLVSIYIDVIKKLDDSLFEKEASIKKIVYSLEELINLESKAEELKKFYSSIFNTD